MFIRIKKWLKVNGKTQWVGHAQEKKRDCAGNFQIWGQWTKQMAKRNKKVNNKPYERIQKYFQWKPASQRNQACKCKSHINQKSIDLFPHDASPQWTIKQVATSVKKFANLNRQLYINFQVLPRTYLDKFINRFHEIYWLEGHFPLFLWWQIQQDKKPGLLSPLFVGLYIYPRESNNKGLESSLCWRYCMNLLIFSSEV